jgi:hypothetical protein
MLTPAFSVPVNARKLKQSGKRLDNSGQEIKFRREILNILQFVGRERG